MDAHSSPHPTAETLEAYAAGKIDDSLAEAVAGHLEDCPECRRRVAEMAPDTFLGRLRDAQLGSETLASEQGSTPHGPGMEPGRTVADPAAATDPSVPDPGVAALPTVGHPSRPSGPRPGSGVSDEPTLDPLATGESPVVSETANNAAEDGQDGAAFPAGTRIGYFGDYELQRVLGEWGMGIVYKARQLSLNRPVALKMIRPAPVASTARPTGARGRSAADRSEDGRCRPTAPSRRDAPGHPDGAQPRPLPRPVQPRRPSADSGLRRRAQAAGRRDRSSREGEPGPISILPPSFHPLCSPGLRVHNRGRNWQGAKLGGRSYGRYIDGDPAG